MQNTASSQYLLQNVKSVNAWNKSSERRRRGSTRSVCASWRSRNASSALVSRRSRTENADVTRREKAHQRRRPKYNSVFIFYCAFQ